ncbi:MAG: hypothetical protein K9K38_11095 [Rhodoferax sp.]|nr:hypothetical protein [Rhodoferax sp.]MCF8209933.1 hypothetical protein [Rhodoferax sp.]
MFSTWITIVLALVFVYITFVVWYGGNGKPMTPDEISEGLRALLATDTSDRGKAELEDVRQLLASDDGKEFIMQNLVRYRPKALYPPGYDYGDDPREADKRYGKSIVWPLLRNGNLLLFIGRRSGTLFAPEGADDWHYVAMVRYRSRRDFLKFAIQANQADKFIHKWAAIEKTHVFPVKPIVSLFALRMQVGLFLFSLGAVLVALAP